MSTVPAVTYPDPQAGRITRLIAGRPAALAVGPFQVDKPVVAFVDGSLGGGAIADGVLGSGFFRRFTVAFDFESHAMHLTPNDRLRQAHVFDASGMGVIRRGGRDVVFEVLAGSAGAVAGVHPGDLLLEIDDERASALTPVALRERLNVDGATRRLLVDREDRNLRITIAVKARI